MVHAGETMRKPTVMIASNDDRMMGDAVKVLDGLAAVIPVVIHNSGDIKSFLPDIVPDLVLFDCRIPGDCASAAATISMAGAIPLIYLSDRVNRPSLRKALRKQPRPYVLIESIPTALYPAVEAALLALKSDNGGERAEIELIRTLQAVNEELVRTRNALAESETRYRTMVELAPWGIIIHVNGILKYMNPSGLAMSGYSSFDELDGTPILDRIHPDDRARVVDRLREQIGKNIRLDPIEERLIRRDGEERLCEVVSMLYPVEGKTGVMAFFYDITDRGGKLDTLRLRDWQYRIIFDNAAEGIFSYNTDTVITDVNRRAADMMGYRADEVVGKTVLQTGILRKDDIPRAAEALKKLLSGEKMVRNNYHFIRKDGEERIVQVVGAPIQDEDGRVVLITSIIEDVTDQLNTMEELRASDERYRALFTNATEGILVADPVTMAFSRANPAICNFLGYSEDELLRMGVPHIHPPESMNRVRTEFNRGSGGRAIAHDIPCLRKDGTVVFADIAISNMELDGRPATVGFFVDVTKRREDELLVKQAEEKYRSVVEKSRLAIGIVNDMQIYTYVNARFCELAGYPENEILGNTFDFCLTEESRALAVDRFVRRQCGEEVPDNYEFSFIRKSGELRQGEVQSAIFVDSSGRVNTLIQALDITEKKKSDETRRSLELKMQHAQKLESLGILAGGIAHDFNNLLMAILGNIDLALLESPEDSPVCENLQEALKASHRAADLCRQMLAYSGKGRFTVETINLNHLIEDMMSMLQISISKKAILHTNLDGSIPAVLVDTTQIRQVIMNLVINASDAIGENNGSITITTGSRYCDSAYLNETWIDENLSEGSYVSLEVSDTGCGMERKMMDRIFDPFFTTRFTGRGLGLAAVLGIVRGHRGVIRVYSEQGRGTTFTILLPSAGDVSASKIGKTVEAMPASFEGTVLLVDDEINVLSLGKRMLERCGFTVITARNGREAVDLFAQDSESIRCVLLDLTMPFMDGRETLREIRRIRRDARVIMTSGYTEQEVIARFQELGPVGFIQKPYSYQALIQKITEILG